MDRFFDIFFSLFLLSLFSPLILLFSILIKLDSNGPALFIQYRLGLGGKKIKIYKLRTMEKDAEKHGLWTTVNDKRITRFGSILRFYGFDELPQLYNVLKGDMSLVGPRPELFYLSKKFEKKITKYSERYNITPGLTGFAQSLGYVGNTSLVRRLFFDLLYIKNRSLKMDVFIIFHTIKRLVMTRCH